MALFDTSAFRILEQGIAGLWQKQQLIAYNISHEDTPDYKCKYMDFSGILKDKIRQNGTVKKELNLAQRTYVDRYTNDQADHNNVDHDTQMAEYSKTAYQIDALINQMNGNFTRIRSAIVTK